MRALKAERQTWATAAGTHAGATKSSESSWPANECSAPSSSTAEERTASRLPGVTSAARAGASSRHNAADGVRPASAASNRGESPSWQADASAA